MKNEEKERPLNSDIVEININNRLFHNNKINEKQANKIQIELAEQIAISMEKKHRNRARRDIYKKNKYLNIKNRDRYPID